MRRAASILPWLPAIAFAAGAWHLAASRAMLRWGADEAAGAAGLIVAAAVAASLWRRAEADRARAALEAGRCPRCASPLREEHEHARAGAVGGLRLRECGGCGYRAAEALTCPRCPP